MPGIWKKFFPNLFLVAESFSELCANLYSTNVEYIEQMAENGDLAALSEFFEKYGANYQDQLDTPILKMVAYYFHNDVRLS